MSTPYYQILKESGRKIVIFQDSSKNSHEHAYSCKNATESAKNLQDTQELDQGALLLILWPVKQKMPQFVKGITLLIIVCRSELTICFVQGNLDV